MKLKSLFGLWAGGCCVFGVGRWRGVSGVGFREPFYFIFHTTDTVRVHTNIAQREGFCQIVVSGVDCRGKRLGNEVSALPRPAPDEAAACLFAALLLRLR